MDYQVTIITPCAPSHVGYLKRSIKSVQGLTTPVLHLIGIDHHRRGAGAVRNALLAKVTTPYVIFLDADDTIEPTFIDETLPHIKPRSYVYTGWYEGIRIKYPAEPRYIWNMNLHTPTYHLITCLMNTHEVIEAGGFDVSMAGMEDKDLFLRLLRIGCFCPIRVNKPLLRYHYEQGQYSRSHEIRDTGKWHELNQLITERYGYKMACCGVSSSMNIEVGVRLDGDALATPLWGGNRIYYGRVTGRKYGRISRNKYVWMDLRDVQADNQLQMVEQAPFQPTEMIADDYGVEILDPEAVAQLTEADMLAMAHGYNPAPKSAVLPKVDDSPTKPPDVERIVAKRRKKA